MAIVRRAVATSSKAHLVEKLSDLGRCPKCGKVLSIKTAEETKKCQYCDFVIDDVEALKSVVAADVDNEDVDECEDE